MTRWSREEVADWFRAAGQALLKPVPPGPGETQQVERLRQSAGDDPAALAAEHVRLFLDPRGAPFSLWQSARAEEPRLYGAAHESALKWFRSQGVEPALQGEPADHAGLLLLFAASLLEADATEEVMKQYFAEHLDWMAGWCTEWAAEARHPFFRLLGEGTTEAIRALM